LTLVLIGPGRHSCGFSIGTIQIKTRRGCSGEGRREGERSQGFGNFAEEGSADWGIRVATTWKYRPLAILALRGISRPISRSLSFVMRVAFSFITDPRPLVRYTHARAFQHSILVYTRSLQSLILVAHFHRMNKLTGRARVPRCSQRASATVSAIPVVQ
jgi:hypothetical protein